MPPSPAPPPPFPHLNLAAPAVGLDVDAGGKIGELASWRADGLFIADVGAPLCRPRALPCAALFAAGRWLRDGEREDDRCKVPRCTEERDFDATELERRTNWLGAAISVSCTMAVRAFPLVSAVAPSG